MPLRQISFTELEVGMTMFRPNAFAAYTVRDTIPYSAFGPDIQGERFEVLEVDGRTVHARRPRDGREYVETAPDTIEHVLIHEEG